MRPRFGVRPARSCSRCSASTAANRGRGSGCVDPGPQRRRTTRFDGRHGAGRPDAQRTGGGRRTDVRIAQACATESRQFLLVDRSETVPSAFNQRRGHRDLVVGRMLRASVRDTSGHNLQSHVRSKITLGSNVLKAALDENSDRSALAFGGLSFRSPTARTMCRGHPGH